MMKKLNLSELQQVSGGALSQRDLFNCWYDRNDRLNCINPPKPIEDIRIIGASVA